MILSFNKRKWTRTINDLLTDYAKKNNIDYYFNQFFQLVLKMNNNSYVVDKYIVGNETIEIKLKELEK